MLSRLAAPPVIVGAAAISWLSMLAHNLYELPLAIWDLENTGPLVVTAGLAAAAIARPAARPVAGAMLGWGLLNLVVGGLVTVLPLPILPFAPEQSLDHYAVHGVYALGQVPLVLVALSAIRAGARARDAREPAA